MNENLQYCVSPQKANLQPIPNIDRISLTEKEKENLKHEILSKVKTPMPALTQFVIVCCLLAVTVFLIWGDLFDGTVAIVVVAVFSVVVAFIVLWVIYKMTRWEILKSPMAKTIGAYLVILLFYSQEVRNRYLALLCFVGIVIINIIIAIIRSGIQNSRASAIISNRSDELEQQKAEDEKTRVEQVNQNEINRVNQRALSLTNTLTQNYDSSVSLASDLQQILDQTNGWLKRAQYEYGANAFAPFWDAVENAAQNLSVYNDKARELSRNAEKYYSMLKYEKHTFPVFPINMAILQDASPVVNEFGRTVRMGQTNYQFASIWEHRKTREVLIAGFRTLGEAVENLGATILYSVSDLQRSISSDIAKVVEENIKTRDTLDGRLSEQNQMLDNIQNRRKP